MPRRIDVAVTPALLRAPASPAIAVVVDVLRATTTIVAALDAGAASIIPVRDPEEAIALMRRLGRDRTLLAGEREMHAIDGFDLDNSPASFTADAVGGRQIVFTTTNGTRALLEAAREVPTVYCAAFTNRTAIAEALAESPDVAIAIVCAANNGDVSFEDTLCAGAIVDAMLEREPSVELTDAARIAYTVHHANRKRLTAAIASGLHAKHLLAAGFAADIALCSQLDRTGCVPIYADGTITKRSISLDDERTQTQSRTTVARGVVEIHGDGAAGNE